uniref:Uncharacterized protein n=1 Tax=Arundo donax TaxID=35708 RepID=A0A0A9DYV8_ARUDO
MVGPCGGGDGVGVGFRDGGGSWAGGCGDGVSEERGGQRSSVLGWQPPGLPLLSRLWLWLQ